MTTDKETTTTQPFRSTPEEAEGRGMWTLVPEGEIDEVLARY